MTIDFFLLTKSQKRQKVERVFKKENSPKKEGTAS